jgi:hypothetical protein
MYRYSHVNEQLWLDAGFSAETIGELIDATQTTLASANLMIDLRIPGAPDYQGGVLDPAVYSWLDSSSTMDEVIADIRDGWNAITDSLGRRTQLQIYRQSIGLPLKDFSRRGGGEPRRAHHLCGAGWPAALVAWHWPSLCS